MYILDEPSIGLHPNDTSKLIKILQKLKENGYSECKIEGYESDDWKLIDATDVIVHLFHPEKRSIYNLEKMWEDILPKEQIRV